MNRQEIIEQRESDKYRVEVRENYQLPHCIIRKSDGEFMVNVYTMRQAINILLQRAGFEMLARREKF